ncbi:MAG: VCBS repeat-containing protein [Bacteroidia bacterium]|nr:VCBS repeat-containing protein [Bacteroidia bacterium]
MINRLHWTLLALLLFNGTTSLLAQTSLFTVLPESETGISFRYNEIADGAFEGGGVGVGDFDADGLSDIFFIGATENQFYQNIGKLKFEKRIPNFPFIPGSLSCAVADINHDNYPDLFIGIRKIQKVDTTSSLRLYINQGNFIFRDATEEWGIQVKQECSSISITNLNMDEFEDIVVSHWAYPTGNNTTGFTNALINIEKYNAQKQFTSDRILIGNGKTFEDQTQTYGLFSHTPTHTSYANFPADLTNDGYPDLYISSDFDEPDYIFTNNGQKLTETPELVTTTSFFSMGLDVADINNDGLLDVVVADMRPINNYRQKVFAFETPYTWNYLMQSKSDLLSKQVSRNVLNLNNGNTSFSEIGELSGIDATDWSWSPLIADFNNDGHKDIFITNGFSHPEYFLQDYVNYSDSTDPYNCSLMTKLKDFKFFNFLFLNNGNLGFTKLVPDSSFEMDSRGAAYADFDGDGDLDLVVNNAKNKSYLYRNNSESYKEKNYIRIHLKDSKHRSLLHSRVEIYVDGTIQMQEMQSSRGLFSSSETYFHFGLGQQNKIDSLTIKWPNGKVQIIRQPKPNQVLEINYMDLPSKAKVRNTQKEKPLFQPWSKFPKFVHHENEFHDFIYNPLLPHFYSVQGPALACGDLNQDGFEDVIMGGAANHPAQILFNQNDTAFHSFTIASILSDSSREDAGILVFDADKDGLNDIVITSGGFEFETSPTASKHTIHFNKGNGRFDRSDLCPSIQSSASCIIGNDFDQDGDIDLFLGGRVESQKFPTIPNSYLLINDNGNFRDVTDSLAIGLKKVGMVTSALWTDFNKDGFFDLIVVGEYMEIQFFQNQLGRKFQRIPGEEIIGQKTHGLWNSLMGADLDNDGDTDYILGNLGWNIRYKAEKGKPLELYANDFDNNGSIDVVTTYREKDKIYPIKQLNAYKTRISGLSKKYYRHSKFAEATLFDIFPKNKMDSAMHLVVEETSSCILFNENGHFQLKPLPVKAQFGPISGILVDDYDLDGNPDILLTGNFYANEVERGRYTAHKGLFLKGDGKGEFKCISTNSSGFLVEGDARSLISLEAKNKTLLLAGVNKDYLRTYSIGHTCQVINPSMTTKFAVFKLKNGLTRRIEFYLGSGYLSQISHKLKLPPYVLEYKLFE